MMQKKIKALKDIKKKINDAIINYNKVQRVSIRVDKDYPEITFDSVIKEKSNFWKFFNFTLEDSSLPREELDNTIVNYFNFIRAKEEIITLEKEMNRLINYYVNLIKCIEEAIDKTKISEDISIRVKNSTITINYMIHKKKLIHYINYLSN